MGTSLTVHPFASLTRLVPEGCPRVLINLDPAGEIGSRPDDVVLLGKSDDIVRDLCKELGQDWIDELETLWKETEKYGPSPEERVEDKIPKHDLDELKRVGEPELVEVVQKVEAEVVAREKLKEDVDKLANAIAASLEIGKVPESPSSERGVGSENMSERQEIQNASESETSDGWTDDEGEDDAEEEKTQASQTALEANATGSGQKLTEGKL